MKHTIRYIWARLKTFFMRSQIKKAHRTGRTTATATAAMGILTEGAWQAAQTSPHPQQSEAMAKFLSAPSSALLGACAAGDSLMDIPRADYRSIPDAANWSLSGQTTGGYRSLVHAMSKEAGPHFSGPRGLVLPSYGNDLWLGPPLNDFLHSVGSCLVLSRRIFPATRLILLELPPTYSPFIQAFRWTYAVWLRLRAREIGNTVVISFEKFGNWNPSLCLSSDGTHFTPAAIVRFDEAIQRAMDADPGTVIYA